MSNRQIELTQNNVTKDSVHVSSSHTTYANQNRLVFPDLSLVVVSLKKIRKLAKIQGVKLNNTTKIMKELNKLVDNAVVENDSYNELFDKYVEFWMQADLTNGINSEFASDLDDNYDLRNIIDKCLWRSTDLFQYVDYSNSILRKLSDFKNKKYSSGTTICF